MGGVVWVLLVFCCSSVFAAASDVAFVSNTSTCTSSCEGIGNPFMSIQHALNSEQYQISLLPGTYSTQWFDIGVTIVGPVFISSTDGPSETIIDCKGQNHGLLVQGGGPFTLQGVTIRNCVSYFSGAGINIFNVNAYLNNVVIEHNEVVGGASGGGVYVGGTSVVRMENCIVRNNKAIAEGGGFFVDRGAVLFLSQTKISCNTNGANYTAKDDVYCSDLDSQVYFDTFYDDSSTSYIGVKCANNGTVMLGLMDMCGRTQNQVCDAVDPTSPPTPPPTLPPVFGCGNGVCEHPTETCLTCPNDCPRCAFSGGKLQSFTCKPSQRGDPLCAQPITSQVGDIVDFMPGIVVPVSGILNGYFRVPSSGQYGFLLQGTNVGARLFIDDRLVLDGYLRQKVLKSTGYIQLESSKIHTFKIDFFSFSQDGGRNLAILWDTPSTAAFVPFEELYYSQNVCFDGIADPGEYNPNSMLYCPADVLADSHLPNKPPFCGDGICQEADPNTCIQDCYFSVTPVCSPLAAPDGHIPAGFFTNDDTLGTLISNQMLYHLPGLEHVTFGIDIVTGEERLAPLFYFGYCDNATKNIVQDMYRGNVYNIPEEVHAEPYPRCSYSAQSKEFSTSSELQRSMAEASSLSVTADISGETRLFQAEVNAAYSQSQSVQTASELETRRSGSLLVSEVRCTTSKVTINMEEISFHPIFVADVAAANTVDKMLAVVYKYGTHYYEAVTLGGKLQQVTSIDSSFDSNSTSTQKTEAATLSFSAAVSSPLYGAASGSVVDTSDSSIDDSIMMSFEQSASRSTIMTFGGAPGAYGPGSDPSTFGDWAQDIDLLPVPIESSLGRIHDLIPPNWVVGANETFAGKKVVELWQDAELKYFDEVAQNYAAARKDYSYYTLYWYFTKNTFTQNYPLINIKLADQKPLLVWDQHGGPGTQGPLRYDTCIDIPEPDNPSYCVDHSDPICPFRCYQNKLALSPVKFDFVAPVLPTTSPVRLYFDGDNTTSMALHQAFGTTQYFILDYAKSQFFRFLPLQQPQPIYNHSSVLVHFTALLLTDGVPGIYYQGNTIIGYMNVRVTVYGRDGQLEYTEETVAARWPDKIDRTLHISLLIPKQAVYIGPITNIQVRAGIPRHVMSDISVDSHSNGPPVQTEFEIADIWAVQTFCSDTSKGLREGCKGENSGLSYVYAAPQGFKGKLDIFHNGFATPVYSLKNRNLNVAL